MQSAKTEGAFVRVLKRELNRMVSRRLYFGVCIILPLFCIFLMSTIFGTGQINGIRVAVVDMDQTATSRSITRTMNTVSTFDVMTDYPDPLAAREAVLQKEIYGYLVIPHNFEADLYGGKSATLPYYYNYAFLSVGSEVYNGFTTTLSTLSVSPLVQAGSMTGVSPDRITSAVIPVNVESHPLFNPSLDYSIYLSNPFFFVLFQILVLLITIYIFGNEVKFNTSSEWLATANGNILIAVLGKMLPYTFIFIFMGLLANFVIFGLLGVPIYSSGFLPINLYTILFILATQSLSLIIYSVFSDLSFVVSLVSAIGSLGATLSGVTFAVPYMYAPFHYLSYLFPIRHFVEVIQTYLYGEYGFAFTWQNVTSLFVYILIALLVLPLMKKHMLSQQNENVQ